MKVWLLSLFLEAVLALLYPRRGGFPAFRRFLWADILCQIAAISARALWGMAGYIPFMWCAEIITGVLLAFVVAECFEGLSKGGPDGSSKGVRKLLAISALVSIPAHLILAVPAWSPTGSLLLWSVALSHSIMGMLLALMLITARRLRWHDAILAGWMLGTAVLFYAAPSFPAGRDVLWLNCAAWGSMLAASPRRTPCQPSTSA